MTIEISDWYDLDSLRNNLEEDAVLVNNLDSSVNGYSELASDTANGGNGWDPIGTIDLPFIGSFDGQGKTISDVVIYRPAENYVGLFGAMASESGTNIIENFTLDNFDVRGNNNVGCVAGSILDTTTTRNVSASGEVVGSAGVGCFVGYVFGVQDSIFIRDCFAEGSVEAVVNDTGDTNIEAGGFIGRGDAPPEIRRCVADVDVLAYNSDGRPVGVGGFVGSGSISGIIFEDCASFGSVDSPSGVDVGGFAGTDANNTINCYSDTTVLGEENVGGFIGRNRGTTQKVYSSGSVSGTSNEGGLVGINADSTFSTGNIEDSFWDTESTTQSTAIGANNGNSNDLIGLTTSEMTGASASSNMFLFDFTNVWKTTEGSQSDVKADTYPILRDADRKEQLIGLNVAITLLDSQSQDTEVSRDQILAVGQDVLNSWSFNWEVIGTLVDEVRNWSSLTLTFRYNDVESGQTVNKLVNSSNKVSIEEISSGGFRGVDLINGENTLTVNSPQDRRDVRPIETWLLNNAEKETLDREGNIFELEIELVPQKEKAFDNEYGTFDSEVNQAANANEWLFVFTFGSIGTNRVETGVIESNKGTLDVYEINMVLTPLQVRLFEENFSFLNKSVVREVPDGDDVVDDTSADNRNTVNVLQPDGADGPISDGEYVCLTWETEWISGAYQVVWEVARVDS